MNDMELALLIAEILDIAGCPTRDEFAYQLYAQVSNGFMDLRGYVDNLALLDRICRHLVARGYRVDSVKHVAGDELIGRHHPPGGLSVLWKTRDHLVWWSASNGRPGGIHLGGYHISTLLSAPSRLTTVRIVLAIEGNKGR